MKRVFVIVGLLAGVSCTPPPLPEVQYRVADRQLPPESVYSRVMWTQPPQPIGEKAKNNSPLMMPVLSFELPESNLEEAIEALAQTIGYNWHYPKQIGRRAVSIKMVGSVEEILFEIGRQGGVSTIIDHENRLVRVVGQDMVPQLPGY